MRRPSAVRIGGAATLSLLAVSCGARYGMPDPASKQGAATLDLWNLFMIAGIVVALVVYGLIAWSIIRYRRRRSDPEGARGASFRENLPLEIVYTVIPIVIVVGLFFLSLGTENQVTVVVPEPDLIVDVEAFAWGWRFTYPEQGVEVVSEPVGDDDAVGEGPELVLPSGQTTRIVLASNDTIHAFWVPGFLFKRDAIPGRTTEFDVTPTREGTYHGACAELCGWNHAYMTFHVTVVSPEEFAAWTASQTASPPEVLPATSPSPEEAAA